MVSEQTIEEYYQLREAMRPFLEERIGLEPTTSTQDAIEAFEQLLDFEEHLREDEEFFDACAESILVAKCLLAQKLGSRRVARYLPQEEIKRVEKEFLNRKLDFSY